MSEKATVRLGPYRGLSLPVDGDRPEDEYARREAAVDAIVAASQVVLPPGLLRARARDLWRSTAADLRRGGIDPAAYLRSVGKTEERFLVEDAEPQARSALERELVLIAGADAEDLGGDPEERMRTAVDLVVAAALPPGDA